jgi:hypothetical protein
MPNRVIDGLRRPYRFVVELEFIIWLIVFIVFIVFTVFIVVFRRFLERYWCG